MEAKAEPDHNKSHAIDPHETDQDGYKNSKLHMANTWYQSGSSNRLTKSPFTTGVHNSK